MLSAVRRGPTSLARVLCSTPASTALARRAFFRTSFRARSIPLISLAARQLHSTPRCRRYAYAEADVEDDVPEEVPMRRNPSHKQPAQEIKLGAITKFQELVDQKLVDERIIRPITRDMSITTMTQVQSLTIAETLKGIDVLAQARTGTGKTIAFLVPVLENILKDDSLKAPGGPRRSRASSSDIRAIIISPTRELAEQIAVEARKLVKYTNIIVQTAVGGSSKQFSLRQMQREGCHVLVGTPGRLVDLLSDEYSGVRAPQLSALVLDEADRLLDQGFATEIQEIQRCLPDRKEADRQTLLFSATVPREVMQIVRQTMKPDFKFVRTVQEGEQPTHEKVPQKLVITEGFENNMPALLELCKRELERSSQGGPGSRPFKALVYFPTTAEVEYASQVFRNLRNPDAGQFNNALHPARVLEIHSKLTQGGRTNAANTFRAAKSAILFSSDVTARGMDFPDVTHVIQVGIPQTTDTYVHRIGRTGRGEKSGEGWLLISQLEVREARNRLDSMPLVLDHSLQTSKVDMTRDAQLPENVAETLKQVTEATKMVDAFDKGRMYMAAIGYYQWVPSKQRLIDALNALSKYSWGMETPPGISPALAQKLGLSRVSGIVYGGRPDRSDSSRENSSRGRGASSFGRNASSSYESRPRSFGDGESRDSNSRGGYGGRSGGSSSYGERGSSGGNYGGGSGGRFSSGSEGRSSGGSGGRFSGGSEGRSSGGSGGRLNGGSGGRSSGGDRRGGFGGGSSRGFDRDRGSSSRGGQGYGGGRGFGER
ncbi:MAG: hypothetical protein M1830_002375 [Pleopsidium flavum]|nr:MAG: hypothetical protein M1830_002375 [Pleopsidium flavum]